jgi:hypothetical protein
MQLARGGSKYLPKRAFFFPRMVESLWIKVGEKN